MIYDDKKFIGKIIKNARKSAKLTQAELAEKIDMSEKNLGNIENGKQFPQVNNFLKTISTFFSSKKWMNEWMKNERWQQACLVNRMM